MSWYTEMNVASQKSLLLLYMIVAVIKFESIAQYIGPHLGRMIIRRMLRKRRE